MPEPSTSDGERLEGLEVIHPQVIHRFDITRRAWCIIQIMAKENHLRAMQRAADAHRCIIMSVFGPRGKSVLEEAEKQIIAEEEIAAQGQVLREVEVMLRRIPDSTSSRVQTDKARRRSFSGAKANVCAFGRCKRRPRLR